MNTLKNLRITTEFLQSISTLDEFKGRWSEMKRLAPERLSVLRHVATIESVGSSTRIEGAKMSDREVDNLLSGLAQHSFRSRDEQEVAGYAAAMETIIESWNEITLTENHIKQLHGVLLKHSQKDERHRGEYKKHPNSVEAFDIEGKSLGVIFETAEPFDTPRLMEELVLWTHEAFDRRVGHPLLVIAVFVVRFLAIHPFQDGNGRLSRILTTLLLLRSGYTYVPYCSLERVIEDNKEAYYLALHKGQSTLDKGEKHLGVWVSFFLRCLVRQKEILDKKLKRENLIGALPPLSEQLMGIVNDHRRLTISSAFKITGVNRNTIKVHLRQLVRKGYLVQLGRGRGTWYEPK